MHSALAQPPRHVPLSLLVLSLVNGASLFGWVFFGFGMIFFWAFAGNADLSAITFRGPHEIAEARVLSVEPTGASEGGSRVQETRYEFSVAGRRVDGRSYTLGATPQPGALVEVEYDADNPERSRIPGMRRALFGPWLILVAIFPLVGLAVIVPMTLAGIRRYRLLRNGVLTQGRLVSKKATNMLVNRRRVYKLTFAFTTRDGRPGEAVAMTSMVEQLQDEKEEPLLYDPDDPRRAFLMDELPTRPEIDGGELQGRPIPAFFAALIPLAAIAVHGYVLYLKVFGSRFP